MGMDEIERDKMTDREFIEWLYKRFERLMHGLARKQCPDLSLHEDIVQYCLEALIRKATLLRTMDESELASYIEAIIRHTSIVLLREKSNKQFTSLTKLKSEVQLYEESVEDILIRKEKREHEMHLYYWQKNAVEAVLEKLNAPGRMDGKLGIVTIPFGTGKKLMLAEIARLVLQESSDSWSVLVLTSTISTAKQYHERFKELLGISYTIELPESVKALMCKVGMPGTILISTAQKLLARTQKGSTVLGEDVQPFSTSKKLLVIVEETAYNYFSRTYQDMLARFPNAAFLGITNDCTPSGRLVNFFGPVLFRYSYEQAYQDGLLEIARYHDIGANLHLSVQSEVQVISPANKQMISISPIKIEQISKLIVEKEQDQQRCVLLLCSTQMEAYAFFKYLTPILGTEKLRIRLAFSTNMSRQGEQPVLPDKSVWDGTHFPGVVIACTPELVTHPFDAVYLDKHVNRFQLLTVLSILMRKNDVRLDTGELIDFCNGIDQISKLLPKSFPLCVDNEGNQEAQSDSSKEILKHLSAAIAEYNYGRVEELLSALKEKSPEKGEQVSAQLAFLLQPSLEAKQRVRYWERHRTTLAWQSDLWRLLSRDSTSMWRISNKAENIVQEEHAYEENEDEQVPAVPLTGTPQERGALLEHAVKQLIKGLFELNDDENRWNLEHLRSQGAGLQFGFDVAFTYRDQFDVETTCRVECKNYRNRQIELGDVAEKLVSLKDEGRKIDHWILISPNGKLSNDLWRRQEQWREDDTWDPIRNVQFWTKDDQVYELFGLFPMLYAQFYCLGGENDPETWNQDKRREILTRWKKKIAPVPKISLEWRNYLRMPQLLLTQREADRSTIRDYEELYDCRVPMGLLDEDEFPVDGTAEDFFVHWLRKPGTSSALLLGDFGDGKTFFTYSLARRLSEEFLESPDAGWIPLRLSLKEFGDKHIDCRQFLDQRLKEFCDGIQSWHEVQKRYHFIIILDGLDEMSLGMNDTTVMDNLIKLEELIEQFQGHKLMVTSRKMVIYSDRVRNRILTTLNQPEIFHLAPVEPADRMIFLERLANTPQRKYCLKKIQNTHDLLGLAAKPLFLDMMRMQLDNDRIQALDGVEIYRDYAERVLERKQRIQLLLVGNYTNPKDIRRNFLCLLEELALCLQRAGVDSISLETFKKQTHQGSLAQLLWDSVDVTQREDVEEDAAGRLSSRSLLKYDCINHENRSFCHRSMKEFFVACGLVRRLYENENEGRELLMTCSLGYEILEFAGKTIQRLEGKRRKLVGQRLEMFAHETKRKLNHPKREQYARLGTNSVNLLHYGGFELQGEDWSELLLDNVVLSGMDLSGKNFSGCSMRYAHLDNTDLTGCDLRNCDFTGVQFEKSGQLISFAVEPRENILLACYKDGKLRRWQISDGGTQLMAQLEQKKNGRLLLKRGGREGIIYPDVFQFWRRGRDRIDTAGYIDLRQGLRIIDIGETVVLVRQEGYICLLDLTEGALLFQRKIPLDFQACLMSERIIVLWTTEGGLELLDVSSNEIVSSVCPYRGSVTALSATSFSDYDGLVVFRDSQGDLKRFCVTTTAENNQWEFVLKGSAFSCDEQLFGTAVDDIGCLYSGTHAGTIILYQSNELDDLEAKKTYRLDLKCANANVEGVRPEEQYRILCQAKENSWIS